MFPRNTAEMQQPIANYKQQNRAKAEAKGILIEFMACKTLTQCKKLINGVRVKKGAK